MARNHLKNEEQYVGTGHDMLKEYVVMFKKLRDLGCSYNHLEKAICAYTIPDFRENLKAIYPNLATQITEIIENYE